jgi:hypothetical protein
MQRVPPRTASRVDMLAQQEATGVQAGLPA